MSPLPVLDALRRGDLAGARVLRLPPGLGEFPPEIFGLADSLELLDLGDGTLTTLPDDMGRLKALRVLFCSGHRFARLPPSLGDCANLGQIGCRGAGLVEVPGEALPPLLRWLTLTDNHIERLPNALGERPLLQKLMLAGNRLRALPPSLADASNLELVRIAANRFDALPPWLLRLPRLAWLAWAGNPTEPEAASAVSPPVRWADLEVGARLGEGASGRVHRATWRRDDAEEIVALKLFRGAMTSDGLPEREMAASIAAGAHPNLAGALGRVIDHPDGSHGLLMPLLPPDYRPLAGPPSLASCSRDVYDPDLRLEPLTVLALARDVASAAAHLHARGLSHGDLYAHNTLWNGNGRAVLSDFGAASGLPRGAEGLALQRIEVRAWGLLFGELLDRCGSAGFDLAGWRELERACVQSEVAARPLMAEVVDALGRA